MNVQDIPIKQIFVVENHRANIDKTHLEELMMSIKQHGLKQAIGIFADGKNHYTLVFGHRRLLACQKLGWETVPATILEDIDAEKMMVLNLTENLQRKDPAFSEVGRGIEKLKKMGLSYPEIAARLGVPEKRIKKVLHIYDALPEKYRAKVSFMDDRSRKSGSIPPQVATAVIKFKKNFGLNDKVCDELINYIIETDATIDVIKNIGIMLNAGLSIKDAIVQMEDHHVYHIDIVANRLTASKMMHEAGVPNYQMFFRKIIYGQLKGIPKPSFIKF